ERKALHYLEAAGDAAMTFYSNREAFVHYEAARDLARRHDPEALARAGEKQGDAALRLGRVDAAIDVWEECLEHHRMHENLERLGETRAASRAHGIFGRVFGRIGDMAKARENLERAVELARGSDQSETILALLALGQHLEVSEADYQQAQSAYADALALAEEI